MRKIGATLKQTSKWTRSQKIQNWQNSWEKQSQENKKAHKTSVYQPQTAAKLIIVALAAKTPHNSEAAVIFEQQLQVGTQNSFSACQF